MERLTPEHCEKLLELKLPVNFANGSFFKPDGKTYCYCAIPYILNSHTCIPCWSLNNLFEYLNSTFGEDKIILSNEGTGYWTIVVKSCEKIANGKTALEAVYNVIINILNKDKDKEDV